MKKIFIFIIIFAIIVGILMNFLVFKKKKTKFFQETHAKKGTIAIEFRETGTVSPRNRLEIKPQVSGRLEQILVVEGQKVKKGDILAWMSSTDRAALLDLAHSKGTEEFKKWEQVYNPTPIISPIDGFIIVRSKEPGQTVTINDIILVLADKLIIEADIDETDLSYIKLNQKVSITLDAYPDEEFEGNVEHIAYESQLINNVNVYQVKILPDEIPKNFRSGMTATIEIVSDEKNDVLLLPTEFLIDKNNKKFVKIKGKNSKNELKEIKTGINNGKQVEIVSGITEYDVVLSPTNDKNPGDPSSRSQQRGGSMGMPFGGRGPH